MYVRGAHIGSLGACQAFLLLRRPAFREADRRMRAIKSQYLLKAKLFATNPLSAIKVGTYL
jgi:hypothetical protein